MPFLLKDGCRWIMFSGPRPLIVYRLLLDYVKSPSLTHIRSAHGLEKLSVDIVKDLDRSAGLFQKWDGLREEFLQTALDCWLPIPDLLEYLNGLPGPPLTRTDLVQRMRYMIEEEYISTPEPLIREECEAIYAEEKAAGTEFPAIAWRISEHIGQQSARIRELHRQAEAAKRDEARLAREAKLLSHADCPWTQIKGSRCTYIRKSGRLFRLTTNSDNSFTLHQVDEVRDDLPGDYIGRYRTRGEASNTVSKILSEPEPL